MQLAVSLLGRFQVTLDNQPAAFATDRARALLAYLVMEANRPHRREVLAGLIWPDRPDAVARRNLSQTLVRLRRAIGDYHTSAPYLLITGKTIQFNPARVELDVTRFRTLLAAAASHPHPNLVGCQPCRESLEEATDLYRGEFLETLFLADSQPFEEWVLLEREQLHRQVVDALHTLALDYERQGDYERVQRFAERQLTLEPWREEAHQQLMRALAFGGQGSAALAQYQTCCLVLADELGIDPSPETDALYEGIRFGRLSPDRHEQRSNGAISAGALPPSAPVQDWGTAPASPPFYGREPELAELQRWLVRDQCRLLAVLGLGGMGKTALAARAARSVADQFDRVIWRSLINAPALEDILRIWLQRLAAQTFTQLPASLDEQLDLLFDYLRQQRCLLVLENVESILQSGRAGYWRSGYEGYGQLIQRMGESEHRSCLLFTSREQPVGMAFLTGNTPGVHSLQLTGLDQSAGRAFLRGLGGSAQVKRSLVQRYSGHPLALKLVSQTIQELFNSDAAGFLTHETPVFDDIREVLDQQVARLSDLEREILIWLAAKRETVTFVALEDNLIHGRSKGALLEGVRALRRRSLLEKSRAGLALPNVVIEYTTEYLIE
jgi:DNA-binding SARP family transcriptional activator